MKLTIYMKSGNQIELPWVSDWEYKTNGNEIVSLTIIRRPIFPGKRLRVPLIDLKQIEAITEG